MRLGSVTVLGGFAGAMVFGLLVAEQGCSHYWRLEPAIHGPTIALDGHVLDLEVTATEQFSYQLRPDDSAGDPCVARDATHFHCVLPPGTRLFHDLHLEGRPRLWRLGRHDWSAPSNAKFEISSRELPAWRADATLTRVLDLRATDPRADWPNSSLSFRIEAFAMGPVRFALSGVDPDASYDVRLERPGVFLVQVRSAKPAPARRASVTVEATTYGACDATPCAAPESALRLTALYAALP